MSAQARATRYNDGPRMSVTRDLTDHPEDWMRRGLCRGEDPDLFHPAQGGRYKTAKAKTVCGDCPVRITCLNFALDNWEDLGPGRWGVWGGTSEEERKELARRMRIKAVA